VIFADKSHAMTSISPRRLLHAARFARTPP